MAQTGIAVAPEFTKEMPIDHLFKIHIAIDFGTDGIGMLWSKYYISYFQRKHRYHNS